MASGKGTIRVRYVPQEGKDATEHEVIYDNDGYKWELAPNETKVLTEADVTLASNATIAEWATTQQAYAPEVVADITEQTGRS